MRGFQTFHLVVISIDIPCCFFLMHGFSHCTADCNGPFYLAFQGKEQSGVVVHHQTRLSSAPWTW